MLQRLLQWLKPTPATGHAPKPAPWPDPPAPRETFPHKPDTLPAVHGFKFRALLLDGRVVDGEVEMLGSWRSLRSVGMRFDSHSIQGWRHA